MKAKRHLLLPFLGFIALTSSLDATILTWDITPGDSAITGGAGTWNTSTANWTSDSGATNVNWPGTSSGDDDAVFSGTAGTVLVDGTQFANDITFSTANYILSGGTINLSGVSNTLTSTAAATISSALTGANGFTKSGSSALTLNGNNSGLSGTISISNAAGTNNAGLILSGADAIGTGITSITADGTSGADGGWLGLASGAIISSSTTVNLSGQGGNSAPPGTLRGTAGQSTVNGPVNVLTPNVRISCSGGSELRINGAITASPSTNGILFRFGDNNGVYLTNGSNSWSGDSLVAAGTLRAEPGAIPAASTIRVAGSGSAWFQTSGTFSRPLGTTSATGQIDLSNSAAGRVGGIAARGADLTVNFGGAGADLVWGTTTGFNPGVFGLNSSTSDSRITLVNAIDLNGGARGIDVGGNTAILQGGIKNSGSAATASIRKTGAGILPYDPGSSYTLSLLGLNTSGGTLELKSGTYTITGNGATSAPAGTAGFVVATGGSFRLNGATVNVTGGGNVFPAGNTNGGSSSFILDSGTFDSGTKESLNAYGAAGTTTINGGLYICGTFRVTQNVGVLNLNGGTLRANNLSTGGGTGTVNFNGGALQARVASATFIAAGINNVVIKSGGAVIDSNGFNITIPRSLTEDPLSTGGSLVKRGGGVLDLTAPNSHTGDNTIQGGVLRISDNAHLGAAAATVTVNGGQFGVSGTAIPSISSLGRTFNYLTGGFNVSSAAHVLDVDIDLTGAASLSKSGSGTIKLSGNNSFTGGISGSGDLGWIEVDSNTDLGSGVKIADFSGSATSGVGGIRLLNNVIVSGVSMNIAGRSNSSQHVLWNVSGNNKWTGDIRITNTGGTYFLRSDSGSLELAGNLRNAQAASVSSDIRAFNLEGPGDFLISGTITNGATNRFTALNANGGGTVTLTGVNTYTGTTSVTSGKLKINGNNSGAIGAISVNNSASLEGSGSIGGAVTLAAAATLAPGDGVGTLTTSANVGGTGTLVVEVDGTSADKLALTGSGTLDISTLNLDVATLGGGATQPVYVIVDSAAAITGTVFASVTNVPSGYTLTYNYNDGVDSNNIALVSGTGSPFTSWATTNGLTGGDALPTADPDNDGLDNAVEFVIGGQPNPANPNAASNALAPVADASGANLVFSFRSTDLAQSQPGIAILAEYGSSLTGWTTAVHGVNGVTVVTTQDGYGAGVDRVDVTIPKALAAGSTLFARLNVSIP